MIQAKKSLGQNFLKDKKIINRSVTAVPLDSTDIVLEIGPGKGALTKALLETGARVVAIEKDPDMICILREKFPEEITSGQLSLKEGDILEEGPEAFGLQAGGYKVVANIPYYITGAILRSLLESDTQPTDMVLMVQKEVAERICGNAKERQDLDRPRKESILSLSVKVYGTPKYVTTAPAKAFSPAPRIDSAVMAVKDISKKLFIDSDISEPIFFQTIKHGFAQKRKTLHNNLKNAGHDKIDIEILFEKLDLDPRVRAEDLPLEIWLEISKFLQK